MNWFTIEAGLAKAAEFVETIAPAAGAGGPVGATIGEVIGKLAGFAQTALTDAQQTGAVISEGDLASIQVSAAAIQAVNDKLAADIAAS